MSAVVIETAVSTSYFLLFAHVQYAVFFRVLPCVIAAPVYYAVFFRVTWERSRSQAPVRSFTIEVTVSVLLSPHLPSAA